ncbi:gamma-glutamyltransferase [Rhizobium sp. AQ_MP]|uniref:gamma-glutamyltransferase n=1 Tax=Rhizobium sp. AQ_MP TaxID=2761536 RepID=UPI001639557C|nr:gamma-glutamyltransferase [Rhizobium sp. AQ_MP]MBC2775662.1 gamma-glutamyltransferase [Rhizobium sp. AQ_MP]
MGQTIVERGIPGPAIRGLQEIGHKVLVAPEPHGGGQMIMIDWKEGVLIGGSDSRVDGCALGY